jgi:hypothetical protein
MADIFQTFLLIATFDIALIAVTIANFAVSASYLGRETRLTRWRLEKRKQRLSEKLKELQNEEFQIEIIKKEIKDAEKDQNTLRNRIYLLSWQGAVIAPSMLFVISFISSVMVMNFDALAPTMDIRGYMILSVASLSLGFSLLLVVIGVIDSAARQIPLPEFEVYFKDMAKTAKVKCNERKEIAFCISNKGEDIAENMVVFINFPPVFKIQEDERYYRLMTQGIDTDYPNYISAIFDVDFHYPETIVNASLVLIAPEKKGPYEIPIVIYERKTGKTKYNVTIEITE